MTHDIPEIDIRLGLSVLEYAWGKRRDLSNHVEVLTWPSRLKKHVRIMREQSITEEPRIPLSTRDTIISLTEIGKIQQGFAKNQAELQALVAGLSRMQDPEPERKRARPIKPHEFIIGAEILMDRFPESVWWPQIHKLGAIAVRYGYSAIRRVEDCYRQQWFYEQVKRQNSHVVDFLGKPRQPKKQRDPFPDDTGGGVPSLAGSDKVSDSALRTAGLDSRPGSKAMTSIPLPAAAFLSYRFKASIR